jgi:hypothetical protein
MRTTSTTAGMLRFFGLAISLVGTLFGFGLGGPLMGILILTGGLLVVGMGKLVESVHRIELKLLDVQQGMDERFRSATSYWFRFRAGDEEYKLGDSVLVKLEGQTFVEATLFKSYATVMADYVYFKLPNREELVFERQKQYRQGVPLFLFQEKLYVSLTALGLAYTIEGNVVWLES